MDTSFLLLSLVLILLTTGSRLPLQADYVVLLPVLQKCPLLPQNPGRKSLIFYMNGDSPEEDGHQRTDNLLSNSLPLLLEVDS